MKEDVIIIGVVHVSDGTLQARLLLPFSSSSWWLILSVATGSHAACSPKALYVVVWFRLLCSPLGAGACLSAMTTKGVVQISRNNVSDPITFHEKSSHDLHSPIVLFCLHRYLVRSNLGCYEC